MTYLFGSSIEIGTGNSALIIWTISDAQSS